MKDTIRWGIIGVGDVTEVKSGPGFQQAAHSELVAVMRRSGAKARDYAERHGVARWYDDGAALINDPDVNAVYVATPPDTHLLYTEMAAAAGKPVLVEKPMARSYTECQGMIAACEGAGVPLWVAYYRRCLPRFVKIKALIESGAIGAVRTISITLRQRPLKIDGDLSWRVQPAISGGGLFADVAVHMLDYLDYLQGAIREARGFAVNQAKLYPPEDNVVGSFLFDNGVTAVGSWCFTSPDVLDQTIIVGSAGQISYSTFDAAPILLTTADGVQQIAVENPTSVHQPLIQSIVDELRGEGQCPSTGISAARTAKVMDDLLCTYNAT